jgi:riboflavin kinase
MSNKEREDFHRTQSQYFNERADVFLQPIPEVIQAKTRAIAEAIDLSPLSTILDVGCGAGALIFHYLECEVEEKNIVGLDLSDGMLNNARKKFPRATLLKGNILDLPEDLAKIGIPPFIKGFDAVVFNACFGNIFDQEGAMRKAKAALNPRGKIVVSHPLGARFVAQLRAKEPHIVPHLLPRQEELEQWATLLEMSLSRFEDSQDFYIAILEWQESAKN